jgi:transcriptional regulator with XRE-family HTH domain
MLRRRIRLKVAIIESGRTQREVAHEIGVTENRMCGLITGAATPRPHEEEALSRLLGRPADELFAEGAA